MARLHVFTGIDLSLGAGEERCWGRADSHKDVHSISRQQFKLQCTPEGLRVTSLSSTNPTKVLCAKPPDGSATGGRGVLLHAGQSRLLAAGDRVLLLACDPSMFVEVTEAPASTQGAPAAGGAGTSKAAVQASGEDGSGDDGGRPSKRARSSEQQDVLDAPAGQQDGPQQQAGAAPASRAAPVMLVLVGVQGAGKSTFCHNLIQRTQPAQQAQQQPQEGQAVRRWVRVNQDSIAGGRRGTKEQCLEAAREALARGDSCLIDRTNVDPDQRRPFVRLAQQQGAQAHCLVLKLPKNLCMDRAAARTDHEGQLQGKAVYQAVNRMHRDFAEAGDPHPREGFASVLICESDAEVAAALEAWSLLSTQHPDPAAEYARLKPPPPKAPKLNTLLRYFGKPTGDQQQATGEGQVPAKQQVQAQQQQQQQQQRQQHADDSAAVPAGSEEAQQQAQPASADAVGGSLNAFAELMAASRQQAQHQPAAVVKQGTGAHSVGAAGAGSSRGDGAGSGSSSQSRHKWPGGGPWLNSLVVIAVDPQSCKAEQPQLWYDNRCVWIQDKFPKARQHWLMVARDRRMEGPLDLTAADIPLVEHMLVCARERIAELQQRDSTLVFRFGFHSVPSLKQLHMHVISQDFDSSHLKNKKHWNSFTSPFFLDADVALSELSQAGTLRYDVAAKEALLKQELRCHRCGAGQPNMPRLKDHIAHCSTPLPGAT